MFVSVSSLTSSALVETGEQRSPKYTPESIAPPSSTGSMPIEMPTLTQMVPIVAVVPNAVPVSIETPQFRRNVISSKISGRMRSTAQQMMNGSVPHARQNAVRMPMSGKTSSTLADVFTPEQIIFPSSFHEKPCFLPYSAMCVYILALDFIAPLVTALCMGRFLLRHRYVQDKYMAVLASLLVFAPSMWANAVLFGNQSGIVCCCVILSMCVLEDSETLAGLLLAVAMCKPQVAFVFLFPLLCKKHWKAITVTSGTVLGSWLLAAILTESSPISMLTDIMDQGLSYNTSYYGLFNFLLGFGISTKVVLLLDVAVGGVILLAAAAWMFRKKLDNDWLLWYAVTAVVSVMWFYKQSHDYIILALPAIAIFCLPHISLPAWGSILILLVDVIAFAVPKVCTLLCGLPKDVVSPWAKLLETVAIMATLYYVFQSAKRHAAALQQASQNG